MRARPKPSDTTTSSHNHDGAPTSQKSCREPETDLNFDSVLQLLDSLQRHACRRPSLNVTRASAHDAALKT